jgi:delta-aminolevulinic acid dehydratase/porphobilinogen synthase
MIKPRWYLDIIAKAGRASIAHRRLNVSGEYEGKARRPQRLIDEKRTTCEILTSIVRAARWISYHA